MAGKKKLKHAKGTADGNHGVLKLGDLVKILHSGGQRGRITEFRGALGPSGAKVYRIRIRRKPKASYVELPEDQLEPFHVEVKA
jgi:hypothetical protein